MKLNKYLVDMVALRASDLFISVGAPAMANVEGQMRALSEDVIDESSARELIRSILDEDQLRTFEKDLELNIALQVPDAGRFRVNLFYQRGAPAAVCRHIKDTVLSVAELGLPEKLNIRSGYVCIRSNICRIRTYSFVRAVENGHVKYVRAMPALDPATGPRQNPGG